jgi:hypothetical protein
VRRLEVFLYSRRNIVGSLLALGGLALHFVGLLGGNTWLPIVVGLYLIGVLLVPGEQGLALELDARQDSAEVRTGLDRLLASIRDKVADDLYARVVHIQGSILATLATEEGGDATDPNVYLIRQTALSYLPEAFATYLRMPRLFAEHRAVADGQTPHDVLLDQLDLMDKRLEDVADNIVQHDSDKLLANGRFLAEKFAVSSLQVDGKAGANQAVTAPTAVPEVASGVHEPEPARTPEAVAERERVR